MSRRNRWLVAVVTGVAGGALVAAIAYQLSLQGVIDQLERADWRFLPAIVICGFATTTARLARYCLFFPYRSHIALLYVVFVYMRGLTYVLPFRLGEPASLYMLKRAGLVSSMSAVAPAWVLFRIGDAVALIVLLLPAVAFMLPHDTHAIAWVSGLTVATCAVVVLLGGFWRHWIDLLSRYLASHQGRMAAIFDELRLGLAKIKSRSRIAWLGVLSVLITALNVVVCVFALWSLSLPVSLATGTAIAVIGQAIGTLPIRPPLGIGLQESVWTALLVLAGLDGEQAFAGALAVRAAQVAIIAAETIVATAIILPWTRIAPTGRANRRQRVRFTD